MWPVSSLPRTKAAALRDVTSRDSNIRVAALGDLVRHAGHDDETRREAISIAMRALSDHVAGVRSAACVALADLHAADALPALLLCIEDDHPHVRQMAMTAVGELHDARALMRVERALTDSRPEMRYQGLIAYAQITSDAAALGNALVRAATDADSDIRYVSLRLVEEHSDRLFAGSEASAVRTAVAHALSDRDPHVVLAAAFTAARLGNPKALAVIREVVVRGTLDGFAVPKDDEAFAVELAGELGLRDLEKSLVRRAFGLLRHVKETCAMHATIALARLGDERGIATIGAGLSDVSEEIRLRAVIMAGRAGLARYEPRVRALAASVPDNVLAESLSGMLAGKNAPRGGVLRTSASNVPHRDVDGDDDESES